MKSAQCKVVADARLLISTAAVVCSGRFVLIVNWIAKTSIVETRQRRSRNALDGDDSLRLFHLLLDNGDDWQINKNVVDLGIGIIYRTTPYGLETEASVLVSLLQELAKILDISTEKTRITIVDYRASPKIRLQLRDGVDKGKESTAINEILNGKVPLNTSSDWTKVAAARHVYEQLKANENDRANVPKLVFLFIADALVATVKASLEQTKRYAKENYAEIVDQAGDLQSVSMVFMNRFQDDQGKNFELLIGCAYENDQGGSRSESFLNTVSKNGSEEVKKTIKWNLGMCPYKESTECREDCVDADVAYELAFRRSSGSSIEPDKWRRVALYCFKNSTTTCPDPKCEPSEKVYYADDPYVFLLQWALCGTAIASDVMVLINIVLCVCVCVCVCKTWRAKKARERAIGLHAMGAASNSKNANAWSVVEPPDVTLTPHDQLVKHYTKTPAKGAQSGRKAKKSPKVKK